MTSNEVLATFDNTHHALRFEKLLKENVIKLTVMPVPREVSASCGLSVKFSADELAKVRSLASDNEVMVKSFYDIDIQDGKRRYLELK